LREELAARVDGAHVHGHGGAHLGVERERELLLGRDVVPVGERHGEGTHRARRRRLFGDVTSK